jgi:hypothetical protein
VVRKKSKQQIFLSRLLLIIFAAGQVIVYSHQHHANVASITNKAAHQSSRQQISENCQLCDAMHHSQVVLSSQVYVQTTPASFQLFTAGCYDFVSISLILSPGRAPPVS